MPIYRLLKDSPLGPEVVERLTLAYEKASSSETSTAILRSVTPPFVLTNIFARIHSSRARCVSRSSFFSA
jgi:hypothetical protein